MDIDKMKVEELKALAYDISKKLYILQAQLNELNSVIDEKERNKK